MNTRIWFAPVALLSLLLVGCGSDKNAASHSTVGSTPTDASSVRYEPWHIFVDHDCPSTLPLPVARRDLWVNNPPDSNVAEQLIPSQVTRARICWYDNIPTQGTNPPLATDLEVPHDSLATLLNLLSDIPLDAGVSGHAGCAATTNPGERLTVLAFETPQPSLSFNLILVDTGSDCDTFSNGTSAGDVSTELTAARTYVAGLQATG